MVGKNNWIDKNVTEKVLLGHTHVTLQILETLVTEVEAILNDCP